MVDSYKSSVSDAKAYAKRLTVVSLADRDKAREERKQVSLRGDGEYSARLSPAVSSNLLKRSALVSSSMSMAIESVIVEEQRKEYSWVGPAPAAVKTHRETIKPKTSRRIDQLAQPKRVQSVSKDRQNLSLGEGISTIEEALMDKQSKGLLKDGRASVVLTLGTVGYFSV